MVEANQRPPVRVNSLEELIALGDLQLDDVFNGAAIYAEVRDSLDMHEDRCGYLLYHEHLAAGQLMIYPCKNGCYFVERYPTKLRWGEVDYWFVEDGVVKTCGKFVKDAGHGSDFPFELIRTEQKCAWIMGIDALEMYFEGEDPS